MQDNTLKHNQHSLIEHSSLWQQLFCDAKRMPAISQLFEQKRDHLRLVAPNMVMDYAKQCINEQSLQRLIDLAYERDLPSKIAKLMNGDTVNDSETRPALHTALRLPRHERLMIDQTDIVAQVHDSLDKCQSIAHRIRSGVWRGYLGQAITDVVNIGVGGSDLGPLMATDALLHNKDTAINVHFVSSMDGTQLQTLLTKLSPQTTVFVVASKSFGTLDTLSNANTALAWLLRHTTRAVAMRRHFIGISANPTKMDEWGIDPSNQLVFWQWVGGRFSMWSAIGLSVAIAIGMDKFRELLAGANAMDHHFANTAFEHNAPVIMGLLAVWNATFLGIGGHTVLPYDARLKLLPSYLTQLEMESNGKSVTKAGQTIDYATCPILWGEVGSNAQHAFYQLLHQGTQRVSCDFIACIHRRGIHDELAHQHRLTLANCFAQSRVLAFGNEALPNHANDSPNHRYRGNQPSTTILLDDLTPHALGSLIALYEHKVYVASVLWDINPFDQWGVEMGKVMANSVFDAMNGTNEFVFDESTDFLLKLVKEAYE